MEDIIDSDYMHAKKICTESEITNLGQYHDLYLENDTLLLPDFFFFWKIYFKNLIYRLDPATFLPELEIAWQGALKKTKVKLELLKLLIDIDMLLMVEKSIRGEIHYEIHRYAKTNNK